MHFLRFWFVFVAAVFAADHVSVATRAQYNLNGALASGYQNAAYYVNWAIYARNYFPSQLPASELSIVLYAFANLQADGTVYVQGLSSTKRL